MVLKSESELVIKQISPDSVTRLLKELISIPSSPFEGGFRKQDEKEIGEFVANKFEEIGLKLEIYSLPESDRPVIVGILEGKKERPALMLEAHLDTAPVVDVDKWEHDPFGEVVGTRIYGRGAVDSKGSLAAMIAAAEAIQNSGIELDGTLVVVADSDGEGMTGMAGADILVKAGVANRTDWVISGEATKCTEIGIAYKGIINYEITAIGKSAHVTAPEEGINAISKMVKVVLALENLKLSHQKHEYLGHPTKHLWLIQGGGVPSVIPSHCRIGFRVSLVPNMTEENVRKEIMEALDALKKEDPDLRYEIKLLPRRPDLTHLTPVVISPNEPIVVALGNAIKQVTRRDPWIGAFWGWWDPGAQMMIRGKVYGKPPAATFGPGDGKLAHAVNEFVSIEELSDSTKIYALTALNLLR